MKYGVVRITPELLLSIFKTGIIYVGKKKWNIKGLPKDAVIDKTQYWHATDIIEMTVLSKEFEDNERDRIDITITAEEMQAEEM